jgi:hypothetical protein
VAYRPRSDGFEVSPRVQVTATVLLPGLSGLHFPVRGTCSLYVTLTYRLFTSRLHVATNSPERKLRVLWIEPRAAKLSGDSHPLSYHPILRGGKDYEAGFGRVTTGHTRIL